MAGQDRKGLGRLREGFTTYKINIVHFTNPCLEMESFSKTPKVLGGVLTITGFGSVGYENAPIVQSRAKVISIDHFICPQRYTSVEGQVGKWVVSSGQCATGHCAIDGRWVTGRVQKM